MASVTYHTNGIILHYYDAGEADRIFVIFSEDFGLLRIFAKGVRSIKSKLAPHLTLFSKSRIAFVSGTSFLRLVDAEVHTACNLRGEAFEAGGRLSRAITRLIQGQEPDVRVWQLLVSAFSFLEHKAMPKDTADFFCTLFAVRLLARLGYVGNVSDAEKDIIFGNNWIFQERGAKSNVFDQLRALLHKGLRISQL